MAIKQDSNLASLAFAEEASLKTLPGSPVWYYLDPNSMGDFGSSTKSVSRSTINPSRQKKRGGLVDIDAVANFDHDFTHTALQRILQGFFFADALEKPDTQSFNSASVTLTAIATSDDSYSAASGLDVFLPGHLVKVSGCTLGANNGLKLVATAAAGKITVSTNLSDETPTSAARIEAVGFQFASGDLTITATSTEITIGCTAADFTDLDLNVGEWVFIGGDTTATKFANMAPFYGRIKSIAAKSLVLNETTVTGVSDSGTSKTIQMFFGKSLKNQSGTDIVRRTYQLERQLGNDGVGIQSEYVLGAIPNEFSLKVPTTDKITSSFSFVGMESEYRTGTEAIKTGTRVNAPAEGCYNTSQDVYRIKMSIFNSTINNSPLFAYPTDFNISLKNGVKPIKAIGTVGSIEASTGDFEVTGSMTAIFDTVAPIETVQADSDISINLISATDNAGFVFDMPLCSLSNAKIQVEKDKEITIPLDAMAYESSLGHTLALTFFNYLPTIAMA